MDRNIIAILRGITPNEVTFCVAALLDAGINKIEIPLNSPDAFSSIAKVLQCFAGKGIFGAGTVTKVAEVTKLAEMGAQMIVSPHFDAAVVHATKQAQMRSYPGVMTPRECFAALAAGADGLKFFPGELIGPTGMKAIHCVLPVGTDCLAVGGVTRENFLPWKEAGATGFGIGGSLYKPKDNVATITQKAMELVDAYDRVML